MARVAGRAGDDDLVDRMFGWMGSSLRTGCTFAAALSKNRYRQKWLPQVVMDRTGFEVFSRVVAPRVTQDAVMLLFPGLTGDEGIAELVSWIDATDGWHVARVPELCAHAPPGVAAVGVKLEMPWVSPSTVAEVLGLGVGSAMPPTRGGPALALSYRNGGQTTPRKKGGRPEIHLCDIPVDMSAPMFKEQMEATKKHRLAALKTYSRHVAKAKLTFALPEAMLAGLAS